MDGNRLHLGTRQLDSSTKTSRGLGGRPLRASPRRLDLDCRRLAVRSRPSVISSSELNVCQVATTAEHHQPRIFAKMSGATIVASDSIMNFGVSMFSFPHVIFSLGTAPEYDPKLVVESLI